MIAQVGHQHLEPVRQGGDDPAQVAAVAKEAVQEDQGFTPAVRFEMELHDSFAKERRSLTGLPPSVCPGGDLRLHNRFGDTFIQSRLQAGTPTLHAAGSRR